MAKRVLFIDRDGTIIVEPSVDEQVDSLDKLQFVPKAIKNLGKIAKELDYDLVMVTNQDGLGTELFPEEKFLPPHRSMLDELDREGVVFKEILIDRSIPSDNADTRKPNTGLLRRYINNAEYDITSSFVIGDRRTDLELARNLGCKGILLGPVCDINGLEDTVALRTSDWDDVFEFLKKD